MRTQTLGFTRFSLYLMLELEKFAKPNIRFGEVKPKPIVWFSEVLAKPTIRFFKVLAQLNFRFCAV